MTALHLGLRHRGWLFDLDGSLREVGRCIAFLSGITSADDPASPRSSRTP